jgi:DNA modification methylase
VSTDANATKGDAARPMRATEGVQLANKLYYGDNLDILRGFPDESVDLVYLDPPWNPKVDYNVIFRDESGKRSEAQRHAFEGTWQWGPTAEDHYAYLTQTARHKGKVPVPISTLIAALRSSGTTPMLAYAVEMTVRLVELHRVLRRTGSLFLHSDPTASHYLKLILDSLFGGANFRNEIIWKRTGSHNSANRFGPVHDVILFYARSSEARFHRVNGPYADGYVASHFRSRDERGLFQAVSLTGPGVRTGDSGKPWRGYDPSTVGRHWQPASYLYAKYRELTGTDLAQYQLLERLDRLDDVGLIYTSRKATGVPRYRYYLADAPGSPLADVWTDIPPLNSQARERTGWGTQKPVALLQRMIEATTQPGDIVLDPFCGCGTALEAAENLGRAWLGIDITWHAMAVMKARLRARFGIDAQVEGAPTEVEGARHLSVQKPNGREQFEAWALTLVGAVPHGGPQKKGADQGADGVITFSGSRGLESAIVSAKSGHVDSSDVQKLKGAMQRHGASLGLFVTLEAPSRPMKQEAATGGLYHSDVSGKDYQRVQILTIAELLEERRQPDLPPLLASEYRETLWSDEEVPVVTRPRQRRRRVAQQTRWVAQPAPVAADTEFAAQVRADYAASAIETGPRSRARAVGGPSSLRHPTRAREADTEGPPESS